MSKLVEIWTVGPINSISFVLIEPYGRKHWHVINGLYEVIPNKKQNTMYICYTKETNESHYLGDVEYDGDYIETINKYRDTKKVKTN